MIAVRDNVTNEVIIAVDGTGLAGWKNGQLWADLIAVGEATFTGAPLLAVAAQVNEVRQFYYDIAWTEGISPSQILGTGQSLGGLIISLAKLVEGPGIGPVVGLGPVGLGSLGVGLISWITDSIFPSTAANRVFLGAGIDAIYAGSDLARASGLPLGRTHYIGSDLSPIVPNLDRHYNEGLIIYAQKVRDTALSLGGIATNDPNIIDFFLRHQVFLSSDGSGKVIVWRQSENYYYLVSESGGLIDGQATLSLQQFQAVEAGNLIGIDQSYLERTRSPLQGVGTAPPDVQAGVSARNDSESLAASAGVVGSAIGGLIADQLRR